MAIAKVQFKSSATATPEIWMDTTQKTVAAGKLLSGETALKNDGTDVVGSIASKSSSDLTASGATVTAPAGYYAQAASKSVASGTAGTPTATKGTVSNHSVTVTPSVTNTTGYITGGTKNGTAVTVSASELVSGTKTISSSGETDVANYASASVADGSATTPATSITANPSISVSASGLITATASASKSIAPSVTAGYVSSGTAGTVTVSGSNTQQLSTQAAATITPSTTSQTAVAAGKYTTGAVMVDPIPPQYIVPSGTKEITENGTGIDVSSYASVDVAVPGQEPTGVKYIWSDDNGQDAVDIGDYKYCSVDGAPLNDGCSRVWFNLTDPEDLAVTIYMKDAAAASSPRTVDWGDGNIETFTAEEKHSHSYLQPGRYVAVVDGSGTRSAFNAKALNQYDDESMRTKAEYIEYNSKTLYTLPNTLQNTFNYLSSVKKIAYGPNVRYTSGTLPSYTFANCTSLERVVFPVGTIKFNNRIFEACSSLTSLNCPDGLTTIGDYVFIDCVSLASVTLPSSLTSIGYGCFQRTGTGTTNGLTITVFAETPPTISSGTFYQTALNKIYVPAASLETYKAATNWSTYASYMEAIPE